jgi:aspartate/methionine/tyrosine aminotransferase
VALVPVPRPHVSHPPAGQQRSRDAFAKKLAQPGKFFRYYGWNILLTTGATLVILLLTLVLKLPAEPSYYAVVLSFLLTHYAHDHVLFAFGSGFRPK